MFKSKFLKFLIVMLFGIGVIWQLAFGTYVTSRIKRDVAVGQLQDAEEPLAETQHLQRFWYSLELIGYVPVTIVVIFTIVFHKRRMQNEANNINLHDCSNSDSNRV